MVNRTKAENDASPAALAAAAYDLWQAQWQLLRSDPGLVQDLQTMMEQFGRSMAAAMAQHETGPGVGDGGITSGQTGGAKPAFAASGHGQPDLAELAAAVATLAAKIDRIEARLEQGAAGAGRKTGAAKRKNPA